MLGQRIALVQQRLPLAGGATHGGTLGLVAGEGIKQGQLAGARQQRLLVVLAMNLDQEAGQLGQLRYRYRAAVDEGAGAAVGADHPSQLALLLVVELVVAQPAACRGVVFQTEFGRQLGAAGAVADHAGVGAQAGQKA